MQNNLYEVECININNYGKGVAKIDSLLVFIDDFYPGEKALIEITLKKKNYCFGRIVKLIKSSIHRIDKVCDHLDSGTCPFNDIDYEYELELKKSIVKNNIERSLNITIDNLNITSGDIISGYRNKVTVFFKKEINKTVFGTFKEGTNELIIINSCVQINEIKNKILNSICHLIDKYNVSLFDYNNKTGFLKGVVIKESEYSKEILIMFLSRKDDKNIDVLSKELVDIYPNIVGISISIDDSYNTFIYSGTERIIIGKNEIEEKILNSIFKINNQSFLQVNTSCASKLYECAINKGIKSKDDVVLDLYSGCGGISLNAALLSKEVIGIEVVDSAIELAKRNAIINNIKNVYFYSDDAINYNKYIKNKSVDVVFVDPPRKGLDPKMVNELLSSNFKRIVYVSCDPYTLSRDIKLLSEKYIMESIECFNMFPRTKHVETVCSLIKK